MEEDDANLIKDRVMFRLLNYQQRMAIRYRRRKEVVEENNFRPLEKQIRRKALDSEDLQRAGGSTLGEVLPCDEKKCKERSALEDRLEKMSLPVDLR
jgi:hypothetical protein